MRRIESMASLGGNKASHNPLVVTTDRHLTNVDSDQNPENMHFSMSNFRRRTKTLTSGDKTADRLRDFKSPATPVSVTFSLTY